VRVEPCTAIAEWLKQREPSAPLPIFSTMALVHGNEAFGARHLKAGFSFNAQMDLLWACDFPEVAFIVDGVPSEDTREALLSLYDASSEKTSLWKWLQLKTGRVYTRRGAFLRIYECLNRGKLPGASALRIEDENEFLNATAPRQLTEGDIKAVLCAENEDDDALLLEALVGPDIVVEAIIALLGDPACEGRLNELLTCVRPIVTRLRSPAYAAFQTSLQRWLSTRTGDEHSWWSVEQLVGSESSSPDAFRNDCENPDLEVLATWSPLDFQIAYTRVRSSIRSPRILPSLLEVGAMKETKEVVTAWLIAHGGEFREALDGLANGADAKVARRAKAALKQLGGGQK